MKTLIIFGLLALHAVALSNEPVYIDVRTWAEHQVNHIDGDKRIHVSEIVDGVQSQFPDKTTPIRLYCARGVRAQTAMDRLLEAGYTDVQNLGGIDQVKVERGLQAADDGAPGNR